MKYKVCLRREESVSFIVETETPEEALMKVSEPDEMNDEEKYSEEVFGMDHVSHYHVYNNDDFALENPLLKEDKGSNWRY